MMLKRKTLGTILFFALAAAMGTGQIRVETRCGPAPFFRWPPGDPIFTPGATPRNPGGVARPSGNPTAPEGEGEATPTPPRGGEATPGNSKTPRGIGKPTTGDGTPRDTGKPTGGQTGGERGMAGGSRPQPGTGGGVTTGVGGVSSGGSGRKKNDRTFEDALHWAYWWHFNRAEFMDTRSGSVNAAVRTTGVTPTAKARAAAMRRRTLPYLRDALGDTDDRVRAAAVLALGKCGEAADEAALIAALADPAIDVRENACLALGLVGGEKAREALLDIALDAPRATVLLGAKRRTSADLRGHAMIALSLAATRTPSTASEVGALIGLASTDKKDKEINVAATVALGITGDSSTIGTLVQIAKDHEAEALGAAAVTAIGKIGERSTVPQMTLWLDSHSVHVRRSAAVALGSLAFADDKTVIAALKEAATADQDAAVRRFAIIALGQIGGPDAIAFLESALSTTAKEGERAFVAIALGLACRADQKTDHSATGALLLAGMNAQKSCETMGAYAIGCGLMGYRPAAGDLRRVLTSRAHGHLRADCARALGLLGDPASGDALGEAAAATDDADVRLAAAEALAMIRDPKAILRLNEVMMNSGGAVIVGGATLLGLGLVGDQDVIAALGDVLRTVARPGAVRAYAAEALGTIGDRDDTSPLKRWGRGENYVSHSGVIAYLLGRLF